VQCKSRQHLDVGAKKLGWIGEFKIGFQMTAKGFVRAFMCTRARVYAHARACVRAYSIYR